ncbi:hypothetical protein Tco_0549281 [Tanacetum coccineum]
MNKRKKHFAKLRAEEIRRKPPTKAQKRNKMSTYLKNMAGYKHSQLKSKSYDEIQKLFDKEMKRVNSFVDMNSEAVKGSEIRTEKSSKRARDELESDMLKKQKIDKHVKVEKDDQEEAEMKRHIEIVKDDEVAIDAIPLATKPPVIVKERLARQKEEEANIALIESWDNTQAMMDADFELAQRLQAEEQGEITIEERSRLFVEFMNNRKKHFAKLRAEEIRRKPPTKAQKRNQMSTYLKNMAGYKHSQLKSKSYDEIQNLFDKEMKRVNTFVDMNSKVVKGSKTKTDESSKTAGDELESDMLKKQKIDEHVKVEKDDQEKAEMKRHIEIVKDDEVAIDAISLATKPPVIVEERLARQKEEEANIALTESWDNTQAMMDADFELAQRLQAEERGEITIEERSRLFVEIMNKRKKQFAMLRAKEIRRKPPTKAQKRNQMSTYLKNMTGYKHKVVKGSETRTEESSKRAGDELESDMLKKQKIDEHVKVEKDDQEEAEMKRHIEIVKDDEVEIDAIPLATKPPVIVEYQIDKDKRMGYFKLIRVDGRSKRAISYDKSEKLLDKELEKSKIHNDSEVVKAVRQEQKESSKEQGDE